MMYALLTNLGALVRLQDIPSDPPVLPPEKGLRWVPFIEVPAVPTDLECADGHSDGLEDEKWVRRYRTREKTYAERRLTVHPCYASVQDQMDMQFKDRQDGGTRWVDHVSAVKTAHPKPVV